MADYFSRFKRVQGHIPKKEIETSRCQNTVAALLVGLRYRIMKLLPLHFSTFTIWQNIAHNATTLRFPFVTSIFQIGTHSVHCRELSQTWSYFLCFRNHIVNVNSVYKGINQCKYSSFLVWNSQEEDMAAISDDTQNMRNRTWKRSLLNFKLESLAQKHPSCRKLFVRSVSWRNSRWKLAENAKVENRYKRLTYRILAKWGLI